MNTRAPQEEGIRPWLRREARREAQHALLFLAVGFTVVFVLHLFWAGFDAHWARLNERLARTAVHQNPLALLDTFSSRLHDVAVLMAKGREITAADLGLQAPAGPQPAAEEMSLDQAEKIFIQKVLARHGGDVRKAADQLGMSRSALYRRLQHFGL